MSGYSSLAIAKELNELGVLSPAEYKRAKGFHYRPGFCRGKRSLWSAQTVIRLLKDEVYVGTLAQGKKERISYKVRKQVDVPSDEWIRCDNAHEALVSRFIFDTVQMLLDRDTVSMKGSHASRLYSGLLFCGDCGSSMVRRTNPRNPEAAASFICTARNLKGTCSRHSIREDKLNEAVFAFIRDYVDELSDMGAVCGEMEEAAARGYDGDGEMERIRQELKKCEAFKGSLYHDLQRGFIDERQFQRFREKYSSREAELKEIIRKREQNERECLENREDLDRRMAEFKERLNVNVIDRNLLVMLIERIMVYEGGEIRIVTRFGKGR